jgi:hypothetical protein
MLALTLATAACLLPFAGRAFHMDDTLFLMAARQIVQHPFDPYGFKVVWYTVEMPMSAVTKNPPLASYYAALAGVIAGWSERALHLAFFAPALAVVLGTFYLAQRWTRFPLVAAMAALLTPGFIVSACGVMSDVLMLALWVVAVLWWVEGLEPEKPAKLMLSGLVIAAAALTKYFAAALIPLLVVYSLMRTRRLGRWALYLLIPVAVLAVYQLHTAELYGRGLLSDAAQYANLEREAHAVSRLATALVGLSFAGGCGLTALTMAPLLWPRKQMLVFTGMAALIGVMVGMKWVALDSTAENWKLVAIHLALFAFGGLSALALAAADYWERRSPDSLLLALWVAGTFVFAGFLNWTINVRSVLPMVPGLGILIARRLETTKVSARLLPGALAAALLISGGISLWVAWGDATWANSARRAANVVLQENKGRAGTIWFEGHWGFQHYMEALGARPINVADPQVHRGDLIVVPENNTNRFMFPQQIVESRENMQFPLHTGMTTMGMSKGAGFYSSLWGPVPFVAGEAPPEPYTLYRLGTDADRK